MVLAGARLAERMLAFPRPILTACTGHAYPAGAFLMMASDVRLGAAGPWRIGMNEVAISLTVPHFALALARARLTTPGYAAVSTAQMFSPEDAVRMGYLDRVLAPEALDAAAESEIERLRALDAKAYAATKARMHEGTLAALRNAIDRDVALFEAA